jgi:hypothetical protein
VHPSPNSRISATSLPPLAQNGLSLPVQKGHHCRLFNWHNQSSRLSLFRTDTDKIYEKPKKEMKIELKK